MAFRDLLPWRRRNSGEITETALTPAQVKTPERAGYAYGIPRGGLNEYNAGTGEATQTDRRSQLQQLYEAYLACPWAWACVNAIARAITAGGLVMDWDTDTGEGDQEQPEKPPAVLALERLVKFTNRRQNIRQLMRNVIIDLLVFGDAFIEVVWWANLPVALYNLDNPTTTPTADEHGEVTGYVQVTEFGQRAEFEPHEVIHISLDAPRSAVFGVSPTQANLLPITAWMFAAATGKEMFRKGLPPTVHADFPAAKPDGELNRWKAQVAAQNVGPRNIGVPWITKGGAALKELQAGKVADVLSFLNQKRDEIIAGYGVPPSKVSIIESGNLGGGTGEEQDKTFRIDVCQPIAELILEAFNFAVTWQGFGIEGWYAKFREVDYRASKTIEDIRDTRIRNATYTVNKARTEIGEPPVEGGDDAVIIDRQNLVLVKDLARMSEAQIAAKGAPAVAAGELPPGGEQMAPGGTPPEEEPPPEESLREAQVAAYRARLRSMIRALPAGAITEHQAPPAPADPAQAVYAQLLKNFPPSAIGWVKDAEWDGPTRVPADHIDLSHRDEWAASHDGRVPGFRAKLARRQVQGRELKPAILIRTPGSDKDIIVDGHHRASAYLDTGQAVWAYVGRVTADTGPWDEMHLSQEDGRAA